MSSFCPSLPFDSFGGKSFVSFAGAVQSDPRRGVKLKGRRRHNAPTQTEGERERQGKREGKRERRQTYTDTKLKREK